MSRTSRAPGAEPQTKAGRGLLSGHGHRPVEGDEPDQRDNLWCAADDEPWPCPFAVSLYLVESEARQQGRDRAVLEGMVVQFAYWSDSAGGLYTGGLSALEDAFEVLGWDDPHPVPEYRCDEPGGCLKRGTCGWPSADGYRWTCFEHMATGHPAARGPQVRGGG